MPKDEDIEQLSKYFPENNEPERPGKKAWPPDYMERVRFCKAGGREAGHPAHAQVLGENEYTNKSSRSRTGSSPLLSHVPLSSCACVASRIFHLAC